MNLNEQDPQPSSGLYRRFSPKKSLSHPQVRPVIRQPDDPSYRLIPLTKGQVATVDEEDYERLSGYCWQAHWSKDTQTYYAQRAAPNADGRQVCIAMHREVMGITDRHTLVDHIDRSATLDNRKRNLRLATRQQNGFNSKRQKNNQSGFKGVHYNKALDKWQAQITVNYKHKYLGLFPTPELAHEAYKKAAVKLHGEFANY